MPKITGYNGSMRKGKRMGADKSRSYGVGKAGPMKKGKKSGKMRQPTSGRTTN